MEYLISFGITLAVIAVYIRAPVFMFGAKKSKEYISEHKMTFAVYFILRLLVTFTMIRSIYRKNYYNAFLCILTLILFAAPMAFENSLKIELPTLFEVIILLFIFAAEILGEIESYYTLYRGWDTILHTLNGFLCAAVGFSLFDMLNRELNNKFRLSPFYLALTAFCFSMTVGVMWEFFEYAGDRYLGLDMQKDYIVTYINSVSLDEQGLNNIVSIDGIEQTQIFTEDGEVIVIENGYLDVGINDTMKDLFVNFIGAVVFCISGYFLEKERNGHSIAKNFRIKVLHEPD